METGAWGRRNKAPQPASQGQEQGEESQAAPLCPSDEDRWRGRECDWTTWDKVVALVLAGHDTTRHDVT